MLQAREEVLLYTDFLFLIKSGSVSWFLSISKINENNLLENLTLLPFNNKVYKILGYFYFSWNSKISDY